MALASIYVYTRDKNIALTKIKVEASEFDSFKTIKRTFYHHYP